MITLLVRGTPYRNFISASATRSLTAMTDYFSFTASAVNGFPPVRLGDDVEVHVDGVKIITGFVDTIGGSYGEGAHSITYSGRDKTADFIDSQINVLPELIPSDTLTLKSIVEKVIQHIIVDLAVVGEYSPPPFNLAEDKIVAKPGTSAFDFVAQWARKRQALLTSNADGDIVIAQSSPTDSGAKIYTTAGRSNILTQSWQLNGAARFNKYIARGQLSPAALDFAGGYSTEDVASQTGETSDDEIRPGRQKVIATGKSYSDAQLGDLAKWSAQLAKAKATSYNAVIAGHTLDGIVLSPNRLVMVASDPANISRKMLVNTVTFAQAEGAQSVTRLAFVERDVYTINDSILAQRPVGSLNDAFKSLG